MRCNFGPVAVTATSYGEDALQLRASHFTLTMEGGLGVATLIRLLNYGFEQVQPDYVSQEINRSSA